MYVNRRLLWSALRISFWERPFSARRWACTALVIAIYLPVRALVALGRALDPLLFPGFEAQPLRQPLFIVGAPRSGTTFLQSLLALDEQRFTHVTLYHTILPSVCLIRAIESAARLDRRCGRPIGRLLGGLERLAFGGWHNLHTMQFGRPEEDEGILFWSFVSESVFLLFPYFDALAEVPFPDRLPSAERKDFMQHYRSSLQRIVHAVGAEKTLLSKSTSFAGRIDSMLEAFPDARVVHLVRHPYECLPSHVSLFYKAWRIHSPEIASDSDESRAYADVAVSWMREMYEKRAKFDADRMLCVRYTELVADPLAVVERIYDQFDLEMSAAFRERLLESVEENRRYRSPHRYSLEEFGLSREWVQERLGNVMDAYGFEP